MEYKLLELRSWMIEENIGVYEMLQEIPKKDELNQINEFANKTRKQVISVILDRTRQAYSLFDKQSKSMKEPEDKMPMETYILFHNDKPVVIGGFRFVMNDYLKQHCGHIWYKCRPSERKKGYTTKFTEMICNMAKALGYKDIISQVDVSNIASNKVLINNGFKTYINELCPDYDDTNFYIKKL